MGYYEDLIRVYKFANPKGYRNLKKTSTRRDSALLDSGHYSTQAWGALNKCWKGFKIAKSEFDMKNMFYYAKGALGYGIMITLTEIDPIMTLIIVRHYALIVMRRKLANC